MSKPITLTRKIIEEMQAEFLAAVMKTKMSDGKVTYTRQFTYKEDAHAELIFSALAFAKMSLLVQRFDCEIAWHACTHRDPEDKTKFYVDDILVYPQEVTGVTVDMDIEKYAAWLDENDEDERFDNIHFQGHSHVNLATNPSSTDTDHQEKILAQLPGDSYYIFLIMNKKYERWIRVYDIANNILYENKEVDVFIGEDFTDLNAFIDEAKEMAPKKVTTTTPAKTSNVVPVSQSAARPYQWGSQYRGKAYEDYLKDYYGGYYD